MALIDRLKNEVLDVLAPRGWGDLLKRHGLDISVGLQDLEAELAKPLVVDRTIAGFEDFALEGQRAIEPGIPGLSLLYHALASAAVRPEGPGPTGLPTLFQLDIVENFVYSRKRRTLASLKDPVIAVFALQYREKARTTHRLHADLVFSRTGVARVGSIPASYDAVLRAFDSRPGKGRKGFRVMPARYAAYIAERRTQAPDGSVMRGVALDQGLTFLFPVHKLFEGDECLFVKKDPRSDVLTPVPVEPITYCERHVNEKLARVHLPQDGENPGYVEPMTSPRFDLTKAPFVRDTLSCKDLVKLETIEASCLAVPVAAPLVRTATQRIDGKDEVARFKVPPARNVDNGQELRKNRYWSTLELTAPNDSRAAPEYLSIRQELVADDDEMRIADLNLLNADAFKKKVITNGGYTAAHFIDGTCDGAIAIRPLAGLDLPSLPAYSLVTSPDYFPQVDQLEVQEWLEENQLRSVGMADNSPLFAQSGPQAMSDGRFDARGRDSVELELSYQLPNCSLPHPCERGQYAFGLADSSNYTVTAIVGRAAGSSAAGDSLTPRRGASWLPDGASGVFAPGWDVSSHMWKNQNMMASYGLGSPFPEDSKLCAALNSFWPAVAPDASRTFGYFPPKENRLPKILPTSIPLLDRELGYHPAHPRVAAGEVSAQEGWDGDFGPYFLTANGKRCVNASNPLRADQTRAALDGKMWLGGLDEVTTPAFFLRVHTLRWCLTEFVTFFRGRFDAEFDLSNWWLITCEEVPDWAQWKSATLPRLDDKLGGMGFLFIFARVAAGIEVGDPPLRKQFEVKETLELQLAMGDKLGKPPRRFHFARSDGLSGNSDS